MNHIILIGFMGAGKSAVGRRLAGRLKLDFVDTDDMVEEQTNKSISAIFAESGEACFRSLETEMLCQLKERTQRLVISVGGGLPIQPENAPLLKELGTVVYLEAEVDTLVKRLENDRKRPKLQGGNLREKIVTLMNQRQAIYEERADVRISTDERSFDQILEEILEKVE